MSKTNKQTNTIARRQTHIYSETETLPALIILKLLNLTLTKIVQLKEIYNSLVKLTSSTISPFELDILIFSIQTVCYSITFHIN